ncbi:MAG: CpXC domain-containing protein [Eubacterium sp.]|nr:CpXC domain-containing protein [Eubacterium sp.]
MASDKYELVRCPECGTESDALILDKINTAVDPSMKEMVRTGDAFLFNCPNCGKKFHLEYPFMYHDPDRKVIIYYVISDEDYKDASRTIGRIQSGAVEGDEEDFEGYTFRIVRNRHEFLEKFNIFEADLDDRLVELQKLLMGAYIQKSNPDFAFDNIYYFQDKGQEGVFVLVKDGEDKASIAFDRSMYDQCAADFAASYKDEHSFVIDTNWAFRIFRILQQKKDEL